MKSRRKIALIALLAAAAVLLVVWLFTRQQRRYSWREHYLADKKDPYGTYFLHELLEDFAGEEKLTDLTDSLRGILPEQSQNASYVFVGQAIYMDSLDLAALLNFVSAGNTALISSKTIPYDLMFHLYYYECNDLYWNDYDFFLDREVTLSVGNKPPVSQHYQRRQDTLVYNWTFIGDAYFCESSNAFESLGRINDEFINFASVPYGKGTFYLHTSPVALSNFSLVKETNLEYAEALFSYLPDGPLYWDDFSKVPERVGRRMNDNYQAPNQTIQAESPLQYVLSQPSLAWAWYILLGLGLFYLLFRTRRRQRIIPVREANANTSLEFISTIGRLYFLQQNHKQLCQQKSRLFLAFLRSRYGLKWRRLGREKLPELESISGVPMEELEKIRSMSVAVEEANYVREEKLGEYHQLLEHFYRTCR